MSWTNSVRKERDSDVKKGSIIQHPESTFSESWRRSGESEFNPLLIVESL